MNRDKVIVSEINDRRKRFINELNNKEALILIKDLESMFYLTGYTGDCGVVTYYKGKWTLFIDFRYVEIGEESVIETDISSDNYEEYINNTKEKNIYIGLKGFNGKEYLEILRNINKDGNKNIEDISDTLDYIREIKSDYELDLMEKAAEIGSLTFNEVIKEIKVGMSEKELAALIEYKMKSMGGEGMSFSTISVSGKNTSKPHGIPSDKLLEIGDTITMDFGTYYKGYVSDMTRTVFLGEIGKKQKEVYNIVKNAQDLSLRAIKDGVIGKDIDTIARDYIESFSEYKGLFGHGLGHSLGLYIHEEPRFSPLCKREIKENMVLSVEPGIYISGEFGVRIEDVVIVLKDGCKNITSATKEIIVI